MAQGLNSRPVAAEFLQHANEEQGHADLVAARIAQLQGEPDCNPATPSPAAMPRTWLGRTSRT